MGNDKDRNSTRVINVSQLASYKKIDEDRAEQQFRIFSDVLAEKAAADNIRILDMGGGCGELYGFGQRVL
jgi:hypothetical protein